MYANAAKVRDNLIVYVWQYKYKHGERGAAPLSKVLPEEIEHGIMYLSGEVVSEPGLIEEMGKISRKMEK